MNADTDSNLVPFPCLGGEVESHSEQMTVYIREGLNAKKLLVVITDLDSYNV